MYAIIGLTVGVFTGVGLMRILAMVRDNRIEKLEVTTRSAHMHAHRNDLEKGRHAKAI